MAFDLLAKTFGPNGTSLLTIINFLQYIKKHLNKEYYELIT